MSRKKLDCRNPAHHNCQQLDLSGLCLQDLEMVWESELELELESELVGLVRGLETVLESELVGSVLD